MKLYLSGAIATEPDFVNLFKKDQTWLEGLGYEVVNPTLVMACQVPCCAHHDEIVGCCTCIPTRFACLDTGQAAKSGDPHSWQCYLKHDLAAMLTCDGVAAQDNHLQSRGALLEIYLAMQVAMPIRSVRQWAALAVRKTISAPLHSAEVKQS